MQQFYAGSIDCCKLRVGPDSTIDPECTIILLLLCCVVLCCTVFFYHPINYPWAFPVGLDQTPADPGSLTVTRYLLFFVLRKRPLSHAFARTRGKTMAEPEAKKVKVAGEEEASTAKKAIITGITGQDGSYLAEFLLEKVRRASGLVSLSFPHLHEHVMVLLKPTILTPY